MEEEQTVMQEEKRLQKREVKKDVAHVAGGLILYTIMLYGIVFVDMFWRTAYMIFNGGGNMPAEDELLQLAESGTPMIIGVIVGVLFLTLFMRKKAPVKEMFRPKKRMTPGVFFRLLAVFMGAQFVFSNVAQLLETGLNMIGYSAMESIEAATGMSMTISMLLYASFVGPCAEELIYRGFVLEPLKKHGKLFAIVMSSVLFGVMHGNLPQSMFAVCVGLVVAYTAVEYSITWAILLHVINNFVFAELMSRAAELFGDPAGTLLSGAVILGFFIASLVILWRYRRQIREYIVQNRTQKGVYRAAFTSVTILIFIGFNLLIAVMSIQKLP